MFYLVIGIVFAAVVGAIITQRSRRAPEEDAPPGASLLIWPEDAQRSASPGRAEFSKDTVPPNDIEFRSALTADLLELSHGAESPSRESLPLAASPLSPLAGVFQEAALPVVPETPALNVGVPVSTVAPISAPDTLSGATYSSMAPPTHGDSPYAFGTSEEEKPKPTVGLLRWSGKAGAIQVGGLTLRGPVTYWSEGPSATPELCCVDVTLPVDFPQGESAFPTESANSYAEMTPLQRGTYLLWLAGGRIQPPSNITYPVLWLYGLERRVLVDRLDVSICVGEALRLLPLIRWETLRQNLIRFISWMTIKAWLPEDHIMAFCRGLPVVPIEILNLLLRSYADTKLPLPSVVAFTLMRGSSFAANRGIGVGHPPVAQTEEHVTAFGIRYKTRCPGGLVVPKSKHTLSVAYTPTNPKLARGKNTAGGVLELPDFFKDPTALLPLAEAWGEFLEDIAPSPSLDAAGELEARPDWDAFLRRLMNLPPTDPDNPPAEPLTIPGPVTTSLATLADLLRIEHPSQEEDGKKSRSRKKPGAVDRKKIRDAARVEGFLVLPDLGIAGKEYQWDDPVVLASFPAGTRPSIEYNAAALLLEYALILESAITTDAVKPVASESQEAPPTKKFSVSLMNRLSECFSLEDDDRARLAALSDVVLSSGTDPENIGECLQFWLQPDQREPVRDLLAYLLLPDAASDALPDAQARLRAIRRSLNTRQKEADGTPIQPLELGEKVRKILAPLFKD
ncbi:MAG: TerB N-terminal domain-containing protein [Synergistaceae bacterium]|nr:TerB N-terminal domain-containing protein [Synergistaceae bacterium]